MRLPRPQSDAILPIFAWTNRGTRTTGIGYVTRSNRERYRPADARAMIPTRDRASAAQNSRVIRICSKCGALLLDDSQNCSFCNVPPSGGGQARPPVTTGSAARECSDEPEWRQEVSRRLQQYRERRERLRPHNSQSGLPFGESRAVDVEDEEREPRRHRPTLRQRQNERVEIRIQSELDFSTTADDRARPQTALVPVAGLAKRRWAGIIDSLFLTVTCAGFLGLFCSLGGQIAFDKTTVLIYLVILYLLYAVYFSLFTTLAGATPGMQLLNLSVVRLDGSLPDTRQLVWRSFGYLLAGATLTLGFVWALWDDDRFTWQDRISQTYLTAAVPLCDSDFLTLTSARTPAHKSGKSEPSAKPDGRGDPGAIITASR
jgi:uncharacterized RDD family membrane protein YckC